MAVRCGPRLGAFDGVVAGEVYATTARPDLAQKLGFQGAKVPLPYGPGDGDAHTNGAGPVNGGVSAPMSLTFPITCGLYEVSSESARASRDPPLGDRFFCDDFFF